MILEHRLRECNVDYLGGHNDFFFPTIHMQNKFNETPVVLVTSEHLRTGKEYDASLIWTEDVTKSSFKVCLREMQNFDGKHENIDVVSASLAHLFSKHVSARLRTLT